MLRHIANLGLLFSFITLAVTGVMSFVLPFSIVTARVHIIFGLATIILVGIHLATRLRYFSRIARQSFEVRSKSKPQVPRWLVAVILIAWLGLLASSFYGTQPSSAIVASSYEARHKAEIFRASPRVAYEHFEDTTRVVQLAAEEDAVLMEVQVEYAQDMSRRPAAAVWTETNRGAMIQTLFLDNRLAYSNTPEFGGKPTRRVDILPVWRHRYTLINGIDPNGDFDGLTGATPKHSFSLTEYLETDAEQLVVYLEINMPGDLNAQWPDPHLGQPSMLYAAFIDLTDDQKYHLMQPVGHGGEAFTSGTINYDLETIGSAQTMVEKVLVKLVRNSDTP